MNLMERARLLPGSHAKRVVITFLLDWFRSNELFNMETDGDPLPEPQPVDYDSGEAEARLGEPVMPIRAAFGRHDGADLTRGMVVQRGRYKDNRRHIGNQAGSVAIMHKGAQLMARRFATNEHIPITIWCISMEGEEAEMIAEFVYHALQFWRMDVRADYAGLRDIVDLTLGEETQLERVGSTHAVMAVPVTVVLDIQYEWLIFQKDASVLQTIITQIDSGAECVELVDGGNIPWPNS